MKRTLSYLACALLMGASISACNKSDTADQYGSNADSSKMARAEDTISNKTSEMKDKAAGVIDDASITASVRTEIAKAPNLSNLDISVDTKAGVVTLEGKADTDAARNQAVEIARAVPGVTDVNNHLAIDTDKSS